MHLKILLLFLVVTCHISSSSLLHLLVEKLLRREPLDSEDQRVLSSYELLWQDWKIFKETYNKKYYSEEEDLKRMQIFAQNKLFIANHNDLYKKGVVTFTVEMNEFGALTTDEFNEIYGLKKGSIKYKDLGKEISSFIPLDAMVVPEEKDWRNEGAVTQVKNQGQCGSCWAFSAVGALEGQYFRTKRRLVVMSEQNLMDCSEGYGNKGCGGGSPSKAFKYIKRNGGIDTEKSYPYEGRNDSCRYNQKYAIGGLRGYRRIERREAELKKYVGAFGPVSVLIDAHGSGFQFYEKSVYFNATCSAEPKNLNHAVLVVGYGVENHSEYWLVKNSWGKNWGEDGYIKMARNRNNHCGIATDAAIPIF